ncbi:MAG TPA: methylated-DNA--[protein]-cysteine S-methyltransferase [Chthoniobacterales bacterium]|jgi:AraC family transcriptional regulator of adaptative response/methylated-DNA-[protein]-cysteine methyltransferase|nr:methylated-DNA--[protein]-cysteine S-methyltransferase [Chthoniobacterales bacterium]
MNDYERVATVIRFLDRHHTDQPVLNELASAAGLSPFHFHRLFSAWAGVTPKDFLQCLTLEHVKQLLRNGDNVFDAALNAGLSGPGRLHDLCVTLEAASPGEMKNGGAGMQIDYGFAETPFGEALIAETERGICHLSFVQEEGRDAVRELLSDQWPNARLHRADRLAAELSNKIFVRPPQNEPRPNLRAFVRGTPFQLRVWRALLNVPSGSLTTYGRLSAAINQPAAARAVGNAVGANPISFVIPCHRVIRETGALGNYGGGRIRKRALLGWELSIGDSIRVPKNDRISATAA